MLVLTRKLGQRIYIGDNITIMVVDIDHGKVRLGIEAPRDVEIFRDEIAPARRNPPEPPADRVMQAPGRADEPGVVPGQLPGCFPEAP